MPRHEPTICCSWEESPHFVEIEECLGKEWSNAYPLAFKFEPVEDEE